MRIRLNEPANPRYIHINPLTNTVHLLVPVVTGVNIGADNTCKMPLALQEFFGKRSNSAQLENSARHELLRYKKALEDDIAVLADGTEKEAKRDRLSQVIVYIDTLGRMEAHASLNILSGGHPGYPQSVKDILAIPTTNLYSMRLRPTAQDGMLSTQNPLFSMNRGHPTGTFYHALHAVYRTIARVVSETNMERLFNQAMPLLQGHVLPTTVNNILPAVVAALSSTFKRMFGTDARFDMDAEELQTLGYQHADDIPDEAFLKDFVTGVINSKNALQAIIPPESPFNALQTPIDTEKLSIMTQFLLAEINFYAHAKRMTTLNFGQVVDGRPPLAEGMANVVKLALEHHRDVEQSICNFINENKDYFGLSERLSANAITEITKRFNVHFNTIKESPHFDEFMILDEEKHGGFFKHQGSLCFDFSELMQTNNFRAFDPRSFYARSRVEIMQLPIEICGRDTSAVGSLEVNADIIKAMIIGGIDANDLSMVRRHLLCTLENGRKLITELGRDFFQQFDANPQAQHMFIQIRRVITDANESIHYNQIVRGQETQLLLTPDMARSLYVSAVSRSAIPNTMTSQYSTVDAVKALLAHVGIVNVTVTPGYNGDVVLDTTLASVTALQALIAPFTDAIHLSPAMAKSIYKEVTERYGDRSIEYRDMMALNNQGDTPVKLLKALALLDIAVTPANITFPNGGLGTNGYVIQQLSANHQRIIQEAHEYQANRFKLTQDMARALYTTIGRLDPSKNVVLNQLSNRERPEKLEVALAFLGIEYARVEFNEFDGYYVYLPETEQAKIKSIAHIPLTAEEHHLIGGYRPAIMNFSRKSTRGFLLGEVLLRAEMAARGHHLDQPPMAPQARAHRGGAADEGRRGTRQQEPQTGMRGGVASGPVGAPAPTLPPQITPVTISRVRSFRQAPIPVNINAPTVHLNCPEHILQTFQNILRGTAVLGLSFQNPYTNRQEQFPTDARQLTARHLQILARNELANTTGIMNTALYNGLLTSDQIARIRCLVKATTVAGITYATHTGGYPYGAPLALPTPQKTIVIDQSGFQWQGDLRNTGGLFFYPTASASQAEYTQWQNDMHQAMYGVPRPSSQTKVLDVQWNGVHGRLDLEGVTYGIQKEFLQALDAAVAQGQNLLPTERINFKFLKAGMGFFASGLHFQGTNQQRLEEARLQGILYALRSIREMPPLERAAAIGLVGRIELPFSGTTNIISDIQAAVVALGLEWGGTPTEDAYTPRPGWVNATTNCGDPHAMIGNEGGHQSVDAAMASNAYLDHLNAGFNAQMVLRTSPSLYPTTVALVHPPALVPTAPPVRITPAAAPLATPLPWPPVLTTSATDPLAPPQPWPPVFITPAVATPPWPPAFIPSAAAAPVATPPWPPVFIPPAAAAPVATPPWPPVFIPPAAAAPVATPPWPPAFIPPAAAAPIATPPRPPHHSDAHEPSPQRRPIPPQRAIAIEKRDETVDRLTTLIANIRDKKNNRASWFTLSTDSKVARLQAILDWVHLNEITPSNEIVILALIRDVCAMKRNYLGFYSPHSLTEFNNMVSPAELEHLQQVSSTAKFLVDLGRKPTAIDELIRSGEVQASRMNPL